jgi:hypothetical protein
MPSCLALESIAEDPVHQVWSSPRRPYDYLFVNIQENRLNTRIAASRRIVIIGAPTVRTLW